MGDAERALERLNGFVLYGSKLFVTLAKFKTRQAFWRKVDPGEKRKRILENHEEQINLESSEGKEVNRTTWRNEESKEPYEGTGKSNDQKGLKNKRISGHVENEDLWSFKKCLIGRMASIRSVRSVMTRLDGWGLGEISVRRLGGKTFLLNIEDEDLFIMLEDVNWSYLREIFEEVIPWSEEPIQLERATCGSSEEARGNKHHEEDEALNGCFIGREQNDTRSTDTREPNRHLGERDVKANKHALEVIEKEAPSSGEGIRVMDQESGHAVTLEVNTDILDNEKNKGIEAWENLDKASDQVESDGLATEIQNKFDNRVVDDVRYMGLDSLQTVKNVHVLTKPRSEKLNWETKVDNLNGGFFSKGYCSNSKMTLKTFNLNEGEEVSEFFPELEKRKLKGRRGLGSEVKVSAIKRLVFAQNVDMLFLQETKKQSLTEDEIYKLWYHDELVFRVSNAEGKSRGLAVVWDKQNLL
ncbi:hypothetical protein V6N13_099645 [Hibiscus sabdariffa]